MNTFLINFLSIDLYNLLASKLEIRLEIGFAIGLVWDNSQFLPKCGQQTLGKYKFRVHLLAFSPFATEFKDFYCIIALGKYKLTLCIYLPYLNHAQNCYKNHTLHLIRLFLKIFVSNNHTNTCFFTFY